MRNIRLGAKIEGLQRKEAYDLPEHEFIERPESFRVNLYRKPLPMQRITQTSVERRFCVGDVSVNVGDAGDNVGKKSVNDGGTKEAVLKLVSANNKASAVTIAKTISVAQRTVERYIKELREEGRLIRHGSARGGYWEVMK